MGHNQMNDLSADEIDNENEKISFLNKFFWRVYWFFNLYAKFRRKFPKKGSLSYIIKICEKLQKYDFEILIRDHKANISLPPGNYTESIQLGKNSEVTGF